ncbi:MAG: hypothetical protein IKN38_07905, partial [Clostridia bacterium]|nr:hypothetical protein [Clostridia bacterium]
MAEKENELTNSEEIEKSAGTPDPAPKEKKTILTPKRLETIVAILLGITTLLSAWAAWIGSLHSGIQSINFTESNNASSQGSAQYNLGMQVYLADFMVWNTLKDYYYELEAAKADGDQTKEELIAEKIRSFEEQNASDILAEGVKWMEETGEDNPFKMPGLAEKYFEEATKTVSESQELLEEGKRDNSKGDSYRLVTVIYSLTLFLLGIIGTFKNMPNRKAVLAIAVAFLIFGVIYMCTIPMPTGFENMKFFGFN